MNKILILGSTGMLGLSMIHKFNSINQKKFTTWGMIRDENSLNKMKYFKNVKFIYDSNYLEPNRIEKHIKKIKPDFIINCVGIVKQKKSKMIELINVNSIFPHQLSIISNKFKAKLIHFSTDCVFSGKKGNYLEQNLPDPIDFYGLSKLMGEPNHQYFLTIRTSLIGHGLYSNQSLVDWYLEQKKTVNGFKKAYFTGFPVNTIADIVYTNLIPNFKNGLYHLSSKKIDKYKLLKLIKKIYSAGPIIVEENKTKIDRSLKGELFNKVFGYKFNSWSAQIKSMKSYYDEINEFIRK